MDSTDNAAETTREHEQALRHGDEGLEELQAEAPDQEVAGHGMEAAPLPPLPKGRCWWSPRTLTTLSLAAVAQWPLYWPPADA